MGFSAWRLPRGMPPPGNPAAAAFPQGYSMPARCFPMELRVRTICLNLRKELVFDEAC